MSSVCLTFAGTKAQELFDRIFPPHDRGPRGLFVMRGERLISAERARRMDNGRMRSMALGCPDPAEQKRRLATYAEHGVEARYDRDTGELLFDGGYGAQRKLAKLHNLEID
jgi:hypothetical protein